MCFFPLVVGIERFGIDNHTVDVTVVDVYGQTLVLMFGFSLAERKIFRVVGRSSYKILFYYCSFTTRYIIV